MEIFVGNLPFSASEADISEFFSKCGEVSGVRMLLDAHKRFSGKAYVSFASDGDAKNAIATQNGADFGGRKLRVDYSRPAAPRFNGFGAGFKRPKREGLLRRRRKIK